MISNTLRSLPKAEDVVALFVSVHRSLSLGMKCVVLVRIPVLGFTNCNLGPNGEDTYSTNVSGFDVDMFRQVAQLAGFVEDATAADTPVSSNRYVFK